MIHSNTKKTYQTHGNTQMKCYDNLLIKRKQIKTMEVLKWNAMSPSSTNKTDQTHESTKMKSSNTKNESSKIKCNDTLLYKEKFNGNALMECNDTI